MSDPPRWQPPVPPGPPVAPPPAPEKPVFAPPAPASAEPPPAPPALPLASWGSRAGAYLIDTLAMLGIAAVAFLLAWAISGDAGRAGIIAAISYGGSEYFVRGVIYAPLLMRREGVHNGQTLGKQVAGIRVVRENGQSMDYGAALVRQWLVITLLIQVLGGAFTGGLAALIDYLWPLWDERNRAVHDIIASTLVFRTT
jgi:uncharacterized RDD family membrane protein YckC